jgi:hypothetical protein
VGDDGVVAQRHHSQVMTDAAKKLFNFHQFSSILLDFQIANIICSSQIERRIKQLKSFLV